MALKIGRITVGYVQTNCYFVYDEDKKKCIVFDPADDGKGIYKKLKDNGLSVGAIFLTHGHFDHIMGVKELKEAAQADVYAVAAGNADVDADGAGGNGLDGGKVLIYAAEEEKDILESAHLNCSDQIGRPTTVKADVFVKNDEVVKVDDISARVILTPGHTKGSCCYFFEDDKILISGDTLFAGSCGRTDLPTGSGGAISRSIKEKLMRLEDDVKVYPGHGESTSIGYERKYNPFC